jgi:hypothetical protein
MYSRKDLEKPIGKRLRKPRWLNKLYVKLFGYFWIKCSICNAEFGGHEWIVPECIRMTSYTKGHAVCPNCFETARTLNKNKGYMTYNLSRSEQ